MTKTFPRAAIAEGVSDYRAAEHHATDLQIGLYGLVSMSSDPHIRLIALQAAEAIDLCINIARERARFLLDSPTPEAANDDEEQAA